MLLSLPSSDFLFLKEIYNTFSNYLQCAKPPKCRKEILKGQFHNGVLDLHNIALFYTTLKSSWLRRFLQTNSKRTVIPKSFELGGAFTFGLDHLDRIIEATTNKIWIDVIKRIQMLWQSGAVFDKEAICNTPLWLHNLLEGTGWTKVSILLQTF